ALIVEGPARNRRRKGGTQGQRSAQRRHRRDRVRPGDAGVDHRKTRREILRLRANRRETDEQKNQNPEKLRHVDALSPGYIFPISLDDAYATDPIAMCTFSDSDVTCRGLVSS